MEQPKWLEYFKVTSEQYAQAQTRAESGERTALDLLIEEGKLNEQKYLAYEQKNTKVSFLQTKFFNSAPPIHLWKNLSFKDCRKSMCLPIAEWDGHVIWGKLTTEPTPFDNAVPGSVFILAPCSGLLNYFAKWKEAFNLESPKAQEATTPASIQTLEVPAGLSHIEVPSLKTELVPLAAEPSETEADAPAGLSTTGVAKPISFDLPGNLLAPAIETPSVAAPVATSAAAPAPTALKVATVAAPKPPPALGKPVLAPNVPPPPSDEVSEVKKPAPPIPFKSKAEVTGVHSAPTNSVVNLAGVDNQDKWADLLLAEWLKHFDKTVILIREHEGLMVWRWAGPLNASIKSNEVFPLNTPSVFKIVADTGQPYHGHVTPSVVNDQAFKVLTAGDYPEHITLVPISIQDQVVVQIVGLTTRVKGAKLQLATLVEIGKAFGQKFMELSKVLKAS